MAVKIPDSAILGTRDPRASMSFAPVPTDPVGGAVSRVGGALMGLSAQLHEEEQRSKTFDADSRYLKFEQAWSDELARRSQEAPAGAEGFTETLRRDFDAQAQEFYRSIPDELADRYHTKLTDLNGRIMDRAGRFEQKSRHDFAVVQLGDAENSLVDRAMSDPSQYERALNEAEVLIQNAPLDGIEKEVRARQLRERFAAADVQRRANEGDYGVIGALRGEPGTIDRIIQIESGGNPNAKNPKSSATGLGQFIDSTWLGVVRKHAPHLMEGRSNAEVLALRTDPGVSRRMLEAHTDDNREFLRNRGIEATDGNLYLAHFLGAGGAVRVLSEDPNASVEQVLGASVAAANPFLKGRTVGQLIDWASKKMGEAKPSGPVPSRYDAIQWEDRQKLADRVEAQRVRVEAQGYADRLGAVERAIYEDPMFGKAELEEMGFDDKDHVRLSKAIDTRDKEYEDRQLGVAAIASGQGLNPFDDKARKAVDEGYKEFGGASGLLDGDPVAQNRIRYVVQQTGVVPASAVTAIRGGLIHQDPEVVVKALGTAAALEAISPSAMRAVDGGGQVSDAAAWYRHWTNDRGVSADVAAQRWIERERSMPERKARLDVARTLSKDLDANDFVDEFDSWLPFDRPKVSDGLTAAIAGDYRELFEERFAETGDVESAKAMALNDMKRVYGVSNVLGRRTLMKFPPETVYPAIGGNHDYFRDQLVKSVSEIAGRDVADDDIVIGAIPETGAAIAAGHLPPYGVMYVDEVDGQRVWQTLPGMAFVADIEQARVDVDAARLEDEAEFQQQDDLLRSLGVGGIETGDVNTNPQMPVDIPLGDMVAP